MTVPEHLHIYVHGLKTPTFSEILRNPTEAVKHIYTVDLEVGGKRHRYVCAPFSGVIHFNVPHVGEVTLPGRGSLVCHRTDYTPPGAKHLGTIKVPEDKVEKLHETTTSISGLPHHAKIMIMDYSKPGETWKIKDCAGWCYAEREKKEFEFPKPEIVHIPTELGKMKYTPMGRW